VELCALVSAGIDLEQDAAVLEELPVDRLVEAGQPPQVAAARLHGVELPRAGQVRADEQHAAVVGKRERRRLPHLEERPQILHPPRA
jgi:hypothetical protein